MIKHAKTALAIAALSLGVSTAGATTASATEKPAAESIRATVAAPTATSAWVHFLPTYESDHLSINSGDTLGVACWVASEGTIWDLVIDTTNDNAGYTLASYLTVTGAPAPCGSAGIASGVPSQTWIHLHPQADWEHQILNPGDSIRSLCNLGYVYDPSDGQTLIWDLVVDNTSGLAGLTWDKAVYGVTPPAC
ncbi:hypothetical protein [Streptacidiphilus anmyonensis]|uniref:hypothetical protein n=1 Tax=Streptacidiphilus anmyonensis TaxID=405782 RepID=UPI0005A99610|nr:hypothetical protein [Streptacidiphilus anmyonensis]